MNFIGSALDRVMRLAIARAAVRTAWQAHLLVPTRGDVLADSSRQVAKVYADRGHHDDAAAVLRSAEGKAAAFETKVELGAARGLAELDAGRVPDDLDTLIDDALTEADRHLDAGDLVPCAARLTDALSLAYHPGRHFGLDPSPLLTDYPAFWEPFERSSSMRVLLEDPRPRPAPRRPAEPGKLLVLACDNLSFIDPIVAEYRAAGMQVRVLDLAADAGVRPMLSLQRLVQARLRYGLDGTRAPLPEHLSDDLAWADVIFVEWGHRALVWASLLRGVEAPVVTRVHRYEAMTAMPLLTVWSSVERAIFVAEPIRAVVAGTAPAFAAAATDVRVVPNRLELQRFQRPKRDEAERTLALIGWNKLVKDPAWALDVLAALRVTDDRWRLLLVGEEKPADSLAAAFEYHEALTRRIVKLRDAVEVTGFTRDVPGMLQRVGVILSTSVIEGTHESLLQGAASGALPVVRRWPELRAWGGPGAIYPPEWVVDSPQAAAARILAATPSPAESHGARTAQQWALEHMDWSVARPAFDAAVLHD